MPFHTMSNVSSFSYSFLYLLIVSLFYTLLLLRHDPLSLEQSIVFFFLVVKLGTHCCTYLLYSFQSEQKSDAPVENNAPAVTPAPQVKSRFIRTLRAYIYLLNIAKPLHVSFLLRFFFAFSS